MSSAHIPPNQRRSGEGRSRSPASAPPPAPPPPSAPPPSGQAVPRPAPPARTREERPAPRRRPPAPTLQTTRAASPSQQLRAALAAPRVARQAVLLREVLGPPIGLQGPLGRAPGSW